MDDISTVAAFFGWCTIINTAMLCFATFMLVAFKDFAIGIHSKLFGIDRAELNMAYFKYLAYYKIGIFIFNLTPYLALRIMIS